MGICNCREMFGNFRTRHGHGNSKKCLYVHLSSYNANTLVLSWKRNKRMYGAWDLWSTHNGSLLQNVRFCFLSLRYFFRWVQRIYINFQIISILFYMNHKTKCILCFPHSMLSKHWNCANMLDFLVELLFVYKPQGPTISNSEVNTLRGELNERFTRAHAEKETYLAVTKCTNLFIYLFFYDIWHLSFYGN